MTNHVLIVTDNKVDADVLRAVLEIAQDGPFVVDWVNTLSLAFTRLQQQNIDIILLDFALPDSTGIATFDQMFAAALHIPIVTIHEEIESSIASEAVQRGAQAHLTKGYFENSLVPQALRSIIQRKLVEQDFHRQQARAEIALNSVSDAVICTDLGGAVEYLNIAAEKLTQWSRDDAYGLPIGDVFKIIGAIDRKALASPIDKVLKTDMPATVDVGTMLIRRDGSEACIEDSVSPIHDWDGTMTGVVIVFHDVTEAQAMGKKMAHLAQHDFLTNLPNRVLLSDRIAQAIALAKRHGTQLAVLFLDLDNFKYINDSLGHETGDKLLQSVTRCLSSCVRSSDTVSRQGGDEFVILLTGRYGEDAALTAGKILTALSSAHEIDSRELNVTTSIGISVYPNDGETAETLIKNADTAMYYAKEKGRNNYQFFSNAMNSRAVERQHIEVKLRRALDKKEFLLYYQPKVNLDTGIITGVEALLRWRSDGKDPTLPSRFISIAEDCGLIVPIGRWVLREACTQLQKWNQHNPRPITVAVNISALEFSQPHFFEGVRAVLEETGLAPQFLELEITEGVLMRDVVASAGILQELKAMGVSLAVDDFGTGYSSLSYLKQFPIDVLKIDQSFVSDIISCEDEGIIVSAVIAMGNSLKLRVVAEGVENDIQLAFLKARNCEEGQGYLFSHPLAAEPLGALLVQGLRAEVIN